MTPSTLVSCSDLFGRYRLIKKEGRVMDERATLLKYFHEHARDKLGDPFAISYIGLILSHLKIQDLYYLKSVLESETKRGGIWNKIFFGSIKAK